MDGLPNARQRLLRLLEKTQGGEMPDVATLARELGVLPIFEADGYPQHHCGVVDAAPGLYFLGLPFQYTFTSAVVGGVGNDARYLGEYMRTKRTPHVAPVVAESIAGWLRQVVYRIGFFANIACIRLSLKRLSVELKLNTNSF